MADPLSVLRQYYLNKKEIIVKDDQITFGEISWSKNAKTNFIIYGTSKNGSPKEYYTLDCLLYFVQNMQLKHSAYVRQAAAQDIQVVRRPDRKELLAFLNGEINTSISIDKYALVEKPTRVKRITNDDLQGDSAKKPRLEETYVNTAKQLLAAKLDAPKEVKVTTDNLKSLSEIMTVEKIAAIKTKRLVKKRSTIKENEDVEMRSVVRAVLEMDIEDTKDIIAREKQYRTRNTILQSSKKEFKDTIFAILDGIKIREEVKQKESNQPTPSMVKLPCFPARLKQHSSYNRYDQEKFNQNTKEAGEFNIDTTGTFHGMPLESVTAGINPAFYKPYSVISGNLNTCGLLPALAAKFTPQQPVPVYHKRPSRTPIIIVPPIASTSIISIFNAADILQDMKYVSSGEKRSQGIKRESEILIQRRKEHGTVPYRIIDNPQKLSKEEWERVVAVFVLGPKWQFKGWPFNGNPVEIFSKICAFHMKFDEMRLEANISNWAVSIIDISKTKRHLDRAAIMMFWEILDKHISLNKPHLRF